MNAPDSQGQLSLETLKRLDAVCAAYESAWQKNNPPRIEEFLGDAGEPERGLIFRELLKLDAELRSKAGLSLATEELRSRFPEYSELITGLESKNIADDATMPPREAPGSEAPASSQTIDTEATPAGFEDLPFLAPPTKPGSVGRLGHYDIQGIVGRGGMGVVLKAFDEKLHRIVAIKVLGPQFATNASARRRFNREAKAAAAVSHDHLVPIYAVDEFQGVPFLVMPLIVGKSLQDRLDQSGPLELKEILRIGNQIAEGLAAAHKKGLVHRDIKPGNILLENGVERVKITDFGLARAVDDASVTQSGVITGTPMYMAPEQARGEQVDYRADLFSLGSVLYAMCTGHPPFRATGTHAVLMRVIEDTPRSIRESNPELPDWLEAIIAKLHAKKPEERFQTAKEVGELLEQHLAHLQQPHVAPLPAPITRVRTADEDSQREMILEQSDRQTRWLQRALMAGSASFFVIGFLIINFGRGHDGLAAVGLILCSAGLGGLIAVAGVKQRFKVRYRGHSIRCEKNIYLGESLYLDGRRVDRKRSVGWQGSEELRAVIADGEGAGDTIVAEIDTGLAQVDCRIFVEARRGSFRPVADASLTEEAEPVRAQPKIGKRLAWMTAGYVVVCLVLFIFIAAYSDNGWWSTPWIEFGAGIGFLFLAGVHLTYRPRWLAILPVCLAIFMAALGFVLWPYSTARHFTRLVHDAIRTDGYVQANELLTSKQWGYANHLLAIEAKDGRKVTLSEDDFPLEAFDVNLDRFLENSENDVFRFRITSRWVQDRYCELHMTASYGSLSCDTISFRHSVADPADPSRRTIRTITAQEWMQAHDAAGPPVVAARLPESAAEVLPALVGAWKLDATNNVWNGKPVSKQTTGVAAADWVAGKQFVRVRVQTVGGPDGIQIMAFDPQTQDFKAWIFDAYGVISGPSIGRWEPKSRTLTWTGLPQADTVGVKTLRFVDANTVQGEITFRNKMGNITLQVRDTMKRFDGPADIREDLATVAPPREMAVLDRYVGQWRTVAVMKTPGVPAPARNVKTENTARITKILGGRFIETYEQRVAPDSADSYALATYDAQQQAYRLWHFGSLGNSVEMRGTHDAADQSISWTGRERSGERIIGVWKWLGPDRRVSTGMTETPDGKPLVQIDATITREPERSASLDTDAPANVLTRLFGTWSFTSTITQARKEKPATGVAVIEPVAGGKFMRLWTTFDGVTDENMAVQTYDEAAGKFKSWSFFSKGDSHGPSMGTWNPAELTLTWRETIVGEVEMVHVIRFKDADTFDSHLTYKMLDGKVALDQRGVYRRAKEVVTRKSAPLDPKRPSVLTSLDGLAGFWRTDSILKRAPQPDQPFRLVTDHHLRPILAGHFFEAHEEDGERMAMRNYWLIGGSGSGNHYRFWHFNVAGGHSVFNGAWDETQKKIRWLATDGSTDGHWIMTSPTERAVEYTANDGQGKFLFHAKGVAKKLQTSILKKFRPDHELLPTDNVKLDGAQGWRIDSKGKDVVRLFEIEHPGVDKCVVLFKAKLKTQKMEGGASLEMWARLVDQEFWSKGEGEHQVAGTTNWSEYQIPFRFEKGQFPNRLQLGLRLGGAGTVWLKDVEVSYQPLGLFGGLQK